MSILFSEVILVVLLEKIFRRKFFSSRDWRVVSIFGVVASLVLYPSALGLTRIDTYAWGWACNGFVITVAGSALFLLWRKNKFGILLLLALVASAFQFKSSTNLWDYFIDPIYAILAFVMIARVVCLCLRRREIEDGMRGL